MAERIDSRGDIQRADLDSLLIDAARAVLIVTDAKDRVLRASAAAYAAIPSLADGHHLPASWLAVLTRASRQNLTSPNVPFEMKIGEQWWDVSVKDFSNAAGPGSRFISAYDITDRKAREFDLLESEASLEEASRIGKLGTFKFFWDRPVMEWSHQMYQIHGVVPDGFEPSFERYVRELVHTDDLARFEAIRNGVISGSRLPNSAYRIVTPAGDLRWISLDGRILFDSDGRPYATFGTALDITDAKEREEELKIVLRSNMIMQEALEASPSALAVLSKTPDGLSVYYANTEFLRLAKYDRDDVRNIAAMRFFPKDHCAQIERAFERAIETGGQQTLETKFQPQTGGAFEAQIGLAGVEDDISEQPVCVLTLRDLTIERRRAETLLQTQKLEALGTLSGGVAHEINNLLQPIITLTELTKRIADKDPAKREKYLDTILSSGRKARDVLQQVLTFARKDTPAQHLEDLKVLTEDAVGLARSASPPAVTIDYMCLDPGGDETPFPALVTATAMTQVVVNLVRNAIDAMDGQGLVVVTLERADVGHAKATGLDLAPGPYFLIKVTDTGGGMSAATRAKIFEPFFTTKDAGKGTGLGLSVVYSIVTGWAGAIDIESEIGAGTTVMVYVPQSSRT